VSDCHTCVTLLLDQHVCSRTGLLQLARDLPGLVGADLANIVNEAQLTGERLLRMCYIVVRLAMCSHGWPNA
jgi:hypothetical protein